MGIQYLQPIESLTREMLVFLCRDNGALRGGGTTKRAAIRGKEGVSSKQGFGASEIERNYMGAEESSLTGG